MSIQNRILTWALRRWIKPLTLRDESVETTRARAARVPFGPRLPRNWRIRETADGEWTEPAAGDHPACTRCILYLHGGGYMAMSPRTHRSLTSRLAIWSESSLFSLEYRLAPEHPYPAALADALSAWRELVASGNRPSDMVVAGDSAGGGLALALLVALRDAGEALPAGGVLFSPWTDLAATSDSLSRNDAADPLLRGEWVARAARHYLGDTRATNPLASPVYADLSGLPPLLIQVGDTEVLLDDSRRVAENARRSSVDVTLRIWREVPHGWQVFAPILPEGRDALREASDFIRRAFERQISKPYSARAAASVI